MAGKKSNTAADTADTPATDQVANQEGSPAEGLVTQPDASTETTTAPAAEIVPTPAPAVAAPELQAAEFVASELTAPPVMLHPDALDQLVELLAARLAPAAAAAAADPAPAVVATPAPAEVVQPIPPRVTCRALRPVEHDGVLYGPLAPAGDEFYATATAADALAAIGAVELKG